MAGLGNASIRLPGSGAGQKPDMPAGVSVEIDDGVKDDFPDIDEAGNVLRINHGDGSLTVSLNGEPISKANDDKPSGWFSNLVDQIDQNERGRIAEDLLRGIRDDIASRQDWIEAAEQGIKLLGLKIEVPGTEGANEGAPVEGMSKVRHPLLLEAVLRFQANARSELLPTDGPVKIRNDDINDTEGEDQLANALEEDMNHYLTVTASEYYPDTDRMLLMLGAVGSTFKKVYYCPLRQRPVSETVNAEDLIVNEAATDLKNARRITHRVMMRPSVVRRLQILKVYRDVDLGTPLQQDLDALQLEKKAQQGLRPGTNYPEDRDREIYECYCELEIKGFEHKIRGADTGLEIPYVVTIDLSSKEILAVVRNYREDTKDLPEARSPFVKYTFVPGFGFLDIGLINILGNTTNAITAGWRELLDMGMFSNFPGGLITKTGARQNTSVTRVPPGSLAPVETNGQRIQDAIMPLPYNMQNAPALMNLITDMSQTGMRIGGTSEAQVGEGRADAPVGTTLAMIEQASKVLNSVHKRMHSAQAEEFRQLVEVFKEHPESFWRRPGKSNNQWDKETFLRALADTELTPQADPNTSSHSQRMMKLQALAIRSGQVPQLYDPIAVERALITGIGFSPEEFMAPPAAQAAPPPELLAMQAKTQAETTKADAAKTTADARMIMAHADAGLGAAKLHMEAQKPGEGPEPVDPAAMLQARAKYMEAQTDRATEGARVRSDAVNAQNEAENRQSRERMEIMKLVSDIMMKPDADPEKATKEGEAIDKSVHRENPET